MSFFWQLSLSDDVTTTSKAVKNTQQFVVWAILVTMATDG
jgi:hypothetical protein